MDETDTTDFSGGEPRVAEQLAAAREAKGWSQREAADKLRLPERHIRNLENGNYAGMPGSTYALGFTRNYSRILGLDEHAMVAQLRRELEFTDHNDRGYSGDGYRPTDPGRIPPKLFTWGAIAVLAIILIGYAFLRSDADEPDPVVAEQAAETSAPDTQQATASEPSEGQPATGPVVLTANQDVWLRVYEEDGDRLFENRLSDGESYTVPDDAVNPLILTGRPQALDVTVGGERVARLGRADYTVSDLPISAEALLAREADAEASTGNGDGQ